MPLLNLTPIGSVSQLSKLNSFAVVNVLLCITSSLVVIYFGKHLSISFIVQILSIFKYLFKPFSKNDFVLLYF